MSSDIYTTVNRRRTPQSEQATSDQVPNSAGGYVFEVDAPARLRRFLLLGSEATYYASAADLTKENAAVVIEMAQRDPATLLATILEVSERGAAPRQNPTLFAYAIAVSLGSDEARKNALAELNRIVRTGTHLFLFARYVEQFRGWGRGLRRAVSGWYLDQGVDDLAYQMIKYRQREGWSHRDLLRLAHPRTVEPARKALFEFATSGITDAWAAPVLVDRYLSATALTSSPASVQTMTALVREGLSWEMLPDWALSEPAVWEALLDGHLPLTALVRQLPRLTTLGLLPAMGGHTTEVATRLSDQASLVKARVHPISMLVALRTYASGQSLRGSGRWTPAQQIVDALDAGFYASYGAVTPAGKRTMITLDVSGSMGWGSMGTLPLTPRDASAAIALVTAATEPEYGIFAFSRDISPLAISPRMRLDEVVSRVSSLPFSSTDCALPMLTATRRNMEVDTFVIFTDNETWVGLTHPYQALRDYRQHSGIDAKVVVVGMTSTGFSIADSRDPGMIDVVGFDSAVPNLIAEFSRG